MQAREEVVLEILKLKKDFILKEQKVIKACQNISLSLKRGETLGLVGESGCGKSTLAKIIMQLLLPDGGEVFYKGTSLRTLHGEEKRQCRKHIQMVFQDAQQAFNPKMKIRDIIAEPLHNFSLFNKSVMEEKVRFLLAAVELLPELLDRYPSELSGGQRQRVAVARALALDPQVLVCDEATSALDVSVQKKVMELLMKIQKEKQISILFICHDLALVGQYAHRIAVMYLGNIVEILSAENLLRAKHPYTCMLLRAVFPLKKADFHMEDVRGEAVSMMANLSGCPFQDRCDKTMEICLQKKPAFQWLDDKNGVSCHLFAK